MEIRQVGPLKLLVGGLSNSCPHGERCPHSSQFAMALVMFPFVPAANQAEAPHGLGVVVRPRSRKRPIFHIPGSDQTLQKKACANVVQNSLEILAVSTRI